MARRDERPAAAWAARWVLEMLLMAGMGEPRACEGEPVTHTALLGSSASFQAAQETALWQIPTTDSLVLRRENTTTSAGSVWKQSPFFFFARA